MLPSSFPKVTSVARKHNNLQVDGTRLTASIFGLKTQEYNTMEVETFIMNYRKWAHESLTSRAKRSSLLQCLRLYSPSFIRHVWYQNKAWKPGFQSPLRTGESCLTVMLVSALTNGHFYFRCQVAGASDPSR